MLKRSIFALGCARIKRPAEFGLLAPCRPHQNLIGSKTRISNREPPLAWTTTKTIVAKMLEWTDGHGWRICKSTVDEQSPRTSTG